MAVRRADEDPALASASDLPDRGFPFPIVDVAFAPLRGARSTFLIVLFVEFVREALTFSLGSTLISTDANWDVGALGLMVIVYLIVSCLRQVGTSGNDNVSALTHTLCFDSYVVIATALVLPPFVAFLASSWVFGWGNAPDWDRVSTAWEFLLVIATALWAVSVPMSILLVAVCGESFRALNPIRVARAIWTTGWRYVGTWAACAVVGSVAFASSCTLWQLPALGPFLAFAAVAYFLIAAAWAFGSLAWQSASRWSVD